MGYHFSPEYESVLKFYGYDLENIPEMKMQTTTLAPTSPADSSETSTLSTDYEMTSTEEEQFTTESIPTMPDWTMKSSEQEDQETTTMEPEQQSGENETTSIIDEVETTTEGEVTETSPEEQTEVTTEEPAEGGEKRRRNLRKRGQKQSQRLQAQVHQRRRNMRTKRNPEEIDVIGHQRFLQNFLLQDATTSPPFVAFPTFSERSNQFQQERLLDDTIEHNFYISEVETIKVPYKIYNTILNYAYVERLQSTVLELELDSEDYKLIILLPDYEFGLVNLMKLLHTGENFPNMRDIVKQMTPSWVKTIVPKFMLKGNIILTSDLQNVSIIA